MHLFGDTSTAHLWHVHVFHQDHRAISLVEPGRRGVASLTTPQPQRHRGMHLDDTATVTRALLTGQKSEGQRLV